jgi:hypothetical protein
MTVPPPWASRLAAEGGRLLRVRGHVGSGRRTAAHGTSPGGVRGTGGRSLGGSRSADGTSLGGSLDAGGTTAIRVRPGHRLTLTGLGSPAPPVTSLAGHLIFTPTVVPRPAAVARRHGVLTGRARRSRLWRRTVAGDTVLSVRGVRQTGSWKAVWFREPPSRQGVRFYPGVRLRRGVRLHAGVRLRRGVRFHPGVRLRRAVRLRRGVRRRVAERCPLIVPFPPSSRTRTPI